MNITLPFPPKELNPNFKRRNPWRAYNARSKSYRLECWAMVKERVPACFKPREGKLTIELDFYPPDRRKRDDDNSLAAFKAGRDGIADALGIDDTRFRTGFYLHPYDETRPDGCVEVRIT